MNAHTQEQTRPKEDFDFFDELPDIPPSDLHQLEGASNEREAPSASRTPAAEPVAEAHRYSDDDTQDEMDALDTLDLGVDDQEPTGQPVAKSGLDWKLIGGGIALAVFLLGGLERAVPGAPRTRCTCRPLWLSSRPRSCGRLPAMAGTTPTSSSHRQWSWPPTTKVAP